MLLTIKSIILAQLRKSEKNLLQNLLSPWLLTPYVQLLPIRSHETKRNSVHIWPPRWLRASRWQTNSTTPYCMHESRYNQENKGKEQKSWVRETTPIATWRLFKKAVKKLLISREKGNFFSLFSDSSNSFSPLVLSEWWHSLLELS